MLNKVLHSLFLACFLSFHVQGGSSMPVTNNSESIKDVAKKDKLSRTQISKFLRSKETPINIDPWYRIDKRERIASLLDCYMNEPLICIPCVYDQVGIKNEDDCIFPVKNYQIVQQLIGSYDVAIITSWVDNLNSSFLMIKGNQCHIWTNTCDYGTIHQIYYEDEVVSRYSINHEEVYKYLWKFDVDLYEDSSISRRKSGLCLFIIDLDPKDAAEIKALFKMLYEQTQSASKHFKPYDMYILRDFLDVEQGLCNSPGTITYYGYNSEIFGASSHQLLNVLTNDKKAKYHELFPSIRDKKFNELSYLIDYNISILFNEILRTGDDVLDMHLDDLYSEVEDEEDEEDGDEREFYYLEDPFADDGKIIPYLKKLRQSFTSKSKNIF